MRPQQVFLLMVHPMRCIHIIHVAEVEWPAEMENTSSGRDVLKNVKVVLETHRNPVSGSDQITNGLAMNSLFTNGLAWCSNGFFLVKSSPGLPMDLS